MNLDEHIRKIPDFPKPGILFYDISTLLHHVEARREALRRMQDLARDLRPDVVVGIESRGFIFGLPLAHLMDLPFAMVRKRGKLPGNVIGHSYDLEYGTDHIEIAEGLIAPGARVVVVDDLMATGGTAGATAQLLSKLGAEAVGVVVLIELTGLEGRAKVAAPVRTVLTYEA